MVPKYKFLIKGCNQGSLSEKMISRFLFSLENGHVLTQFAGPITGVFVTYLQGGQILQNFDIWEICSDQLFGLNLVDFLHNEDDLKVSL